jgi:hypothetical protein
LIDRVCVALVLVEVTVDLLGASAILVDVGGEVRKDGRGLPLREWHRRISTGITHDGAAILELASECGREEDV